MDRRADILHLHLASAQEDREPLTVDPAFARAMRRWRRVRAELALIALGDSLRLDSTRRSLVPERHGAGAQAALVRAAAGQSRRGAA